MKLESGRVKILDSFQL